MVQYCTFASIWNSEAVCSMVCAQNALHLQISILQNCNMAYCLKFNMLLQYNILQCGVCMESPAFGPRPDLQKSQQQEIGPAFASLFSLQKYSSPPIFLRASVKHVYFKWWLSQPKKETRMEVGQDSLPTRCILKWILACLSFLGLI